MLVYLGMQRYTCVQQSCTKHAELSTHASCIESPGQHLPGAQRSWHMYSMSPALFSNIIEMLLLLSPHSPYKREGYVSCPFGKLVILFRTLSRRFNSNQRQRPPHSRFCKWDRVRTRKASHSLIRFPSNSDLQRRSRVVSHNGGSGSLTSACRGQTIPARYYQVPRTQVINGVCLQPYPYTPKHVYSMYRTNVTMQKHWMIFFSRVMLLIIVLKKNQASRKKTSNNRLLANTDCDICPAMVTVNFPLHRRTHPGELRRSLTPPGRP